MGRNDWDQSLAAFHGKAEKKPGDAQALVADERGGDAECMIQL